MENEWPCHVVNVVTLATDRVLFESPAGHPGSKAGAEVCLSCPLPKAPIVNTHQPDAQAGTTTHWLQLSSPTVDYSIGSSF